MKKLFILPLCVIFLLILLYPTSSVYAEEDTRLEFVYGDSVFYYDLNTPRYTDSLFYSNIMKKDLDTSIPARQTLLIKLMQANIPLDVSIRYVFPDIENTIARIETSLYISPINASMSIHPNMEKVFTYNKERVGRVLDKNALIEDIIDSFLDNNFTIPIKTKTIEPSVYLDELKVDTHLRADFSTNISSSSPERKHNVKNAINSINLTKLSPNEIFSFNDIVGRRTEQNGYREAKIIVNNEFVDGLGGGVCQVSTTLYNSALLAGLKIIEANKHSRPVTYVKAGLDAMVNYGSSDLKFKNNTKHNITIIATYSSDSIRIRIYGEDLIDTKYRLSSEIIECYPASETIKIDTAHEYADKVMYDDEFFYEKKASNGMKVNSYRSVYINNELIETELLRTDTYKPIDAIIIYGSEPRPITDAD